MVVLERHGPDILYFFIFINFYLDLRLSEEMYLQRSSTLLSCRGRTVRKIITTETFYICESRQGDDLTDPDRGAGQVSIYDEIENSPSSNDVPSFR